ncbi:MAG: hypothetical protein V3U75_02685 [Methylococcaceae bacterium]
MNKVVYIKAYFRPVGKNKTVKVPTGEKKKGIFGGEKDVTKKESQWVETGSSDCQIDGEKLSIDIQKAIESLNSEGYEVSNILQITSGKHKHETKKDVGYSNTYGWGWGWGYGYGYSYTEGVTIIARKIT